MKKPVEDVSSASDSSVAPASAARGSASPAMRRWQSISRGSIDRPQPPQRVPERRQVDFESGIQEQRRDAEASEQVDCIVVARPTGRERITARPSRSS